MSRNLSHKYPTEFLWVLTKNAALVLALAIFTGLSHCDTIPLTSPMEGRPSGPYTVTLKLEPPAPVPAQRAVLKFRISHSKTGEPVNDLQILHERALHTFIVHEDLSTFSHTHHEDYKHLDEQTLERAEFEFPYEFPKAGRYFIVNEFTHQGRSWVKHFVITTAGQSSSSIRPRDLTMQKSVGRYRIALRTSPSPPIAGHPVEIVCHLSDENGAPVGNLSLYLGSEVHMASWKADGTSFGHQHTFTTAMAELMRQMQGHRMNVDQVSRRMSALMSESRNQEYFGPEVPIRHVFPTSGLYKIFLEFSANGIYLPVNFWISVEEFAEGADTRITSILQGFSSPEREATP